MKSVFNKIDEKKSKDIEFPVLAEAIGIVNGNFVVLFTGEMSGVIVKNNCYNTLGVFSDNYISIYDTSNWRILSPEESITLSND